MVLKKEKVSLNEIQLETAQKDMLIVSDLHKRYDEGKNNEVHALRGLNLTVQKGKVLVVKGYHRFRIV